MAACSFLNRKRAGDSLMVNGDVVKEVLIRLWEIFSDKGAARFFPSESTLHRCGEEANSGLGSQHFEEVRIRNQRLLIQVQRFSRMARSL